MVGLAMLAAEQAGRGPSGGLAAAGLLCLGMVDGADRASLFPAPAERDSLLR